MTDRLPAVCLAAMALLAAGCNLDLDTEEFPYRVPLVIDDDSGNNGVVPDANNTTTTPDMGMEEDMAPAGTPVLMFTEILINTSIMDSSVALGELGEFIEVKNVGDGPADPRAISMRLTNIDNETSGDIFVATAVSQEQLEIIRGLRQVEPGEYFVFVRHTTTDVPVMDVLDPGKGYDFGRYGEGVPLSNSDERVLELRYNDGENIITADRLRYRNGNLIAANGDAGDSLAYPEDVSLTVRPDSEQPDQNDTPAGWCLSADTFGESIVLGSPGTAGTCQ